MINRIKEAPIEKIFLYLAVFFGIILIIVQPVFSAPDELFHFVQTFRLFYRPINPEYDYTHIGIEIIIRIVGSVVDGFEFEGGRHSFQLLYNIIDAINDGTYFEKFYLTRENMNDYVFGFNLTRTSFQYLPQGIGMLIGSLIYPSFGVMSFFGRLFQFILFTIVSFFSIKKAKFGKYVLAFVCLLPMTMQQVTSLSFDGMFFITIFAFFSYLTNLWVRNSPFLFKDIVYMIIFVLLFILTKANGISLMLLLFTIPSVLFGKNIIAISIEVIYSFLERHKWVTFILITMVFLLVINYFAPSVGGMRVSAQLLFNTWFRSDINTSLDIVSTSGLLGTFSWISFRLPGWLVIINMIVFIIIGLQEKQIVKNSGRILFVSLIIILANIVLTTIIMYRSWTIVHGEGLEYVAFGLQGRYYTPFLLLVSTITLYFRKYINVNISKVNLNALFICINCFNLLFQVALNLLYFYTPYNGLDFLIRIFN